jgi:hypothetical protein
MPTSNELMRLALRCAEKLPRPSRLRNFPSFAEMEELCGDDYEELLAVLHDDEIYEAADLDAQERLVNAIRDALPAGRQNLVEDLVDNQAAQVWLQQEGAFHLGMAVGVLLAQAGLSIPEEEVEVDEETRREREDAIRFGAHRQSDRRLQYDPDDDEKEERAFEAEEKDEDDDL